MLIAFTGAGISAAAGIPTFQSKPGIREKLTRTYATRHPQKYCDTINDMKRTCDQSDPTDAHKALAEYHVPVITMNIDSLHVKACENMPDKPPILSIHGELPDIVLYGDLAPAYQTALDWIDRMKSGDTLLIIGTSFYTRISVELKNLALANGADVQIINEQAETKVREFLENYQASGETFEQFMERPCGSMPSPYSVQS